MKSITDNITLKAMNLAILDEIETIRKLQWVITKPSRRAELNALLNDCLSYLGTINKEYFDRCLEPIPNIAEPISTEINTIIKE